MKTQEQQKASIQEQIKDLDERITQLQRLWDRSQRSPIYAIMRKYEAIFK